MLKALSELEIDYKLNKTDDGIIAEFMRELFERGIPVTFGSDSHKNYDPERIKEAENILKSAGFKEGDFSEIAEEDLW